MKNSHIEWTDHTFNPWLGCQHVSPGCDHCYAETLMDHRFHRVEWGPHGERKLTSSNNWKEPFRWQRDAQANGTRPRVFCASLADVWDNQVPEQWRAELFNVIHATPSLDWLLLTKRPQNIEKMLPGALGLLKGWPWQHVWLGTTCEDQEYYDRRWKLLEQIPAAVRFISYEPAIGPLELDGAKILPDWVICGGETGNGARRMKRKWARNLLAECQYLKVPFFMKQMSQKKPIPDDLMVRQFPQLKVLKG